MDLTIGGEPGVLTVGHGHDGTPYSIQLRVGVHGSAVSGFADALATAVTVGLQRGVPATALAAALREAGIAGAGEEHTQVLVEALASVTAADLLEVIEVVGR
ncbi:hypothetical protein AB0M46_21705 [Dactylosporangium sp. NPDC051485]|uniref:TSCPD domain-containing protein n=1 Tax=Dactylosporangium sp. NPDC051485 TaxID=3154846 RepID=UPI00341B1F18